MQSWVSTLVLALALLGLAASNLSVCLRLWRDDGYGRNQKALQTLLVWALPVFGALLVKLALDSHAAGPERTGDLELDDGEDQVEEECDAADAGPGGAGDVARGDSD